MQVQEHVAGHPLSEELGDQGRYDVMINVVRSKQELTTSDEYPSVELERTRCFLSVGSGLRVSASWI